MTLKERVNENIELLNGYTTSIIDTITFSHTTQWEAPFDCKLEIEGCGHGEPGGRIRGGFVKHIKAYDKYDIEGLDRSLILSGGKSSEITYKTVELKKGSVVQINVSQIYTAEEDMYSSFGGIRLGKIIDPVSLSVPIDANQKIPVRYDQDPDSFESKPGSGGRGADFLANIQSKYAIIPWCYRQPEKGQKGLVKASVRSMTHFLTMLA